MATTRRFFTEQSLELVACTGGLSETKITITEFRLEHERTLSEGYIISTF